MFKDTATADMSLLDFGLLHYMAVPHHNHKAVPGRWVLRKIQSIVKQLRVVLGRKPLVSDLNEPTYEALLKHIEAVLKPKTLIDVQAVFKGLWRYAAVLELIAMPAHLMPRSKLLNPGPDGKRILLTNDEGTLWNLCQTKYFPRNIRIRCDKTKHQYFCALRDFKEFLGRDAVLSDLNDDNIAGMMLHLADKKLSPKTINERSGRICAFWTWCAKKRMVEDFPTSQKLTVPHRIPRAWTVEELTKLFEECQAAPGRIGKHHARHWWYAFHLVLWDTGGRKGELLAIRWEWLKWETGDLHVPAEVRKGRDKDMAYKLHPDTLAALRKIHDPSEAMMFEWPYCEGTLYKRYSTIKKNAGLSSTKAGFHKMRRSVASYVQAAGYNATDVLAHSSSDLTRKSYLDTTITGAVKASDVLFRPVVSGKPMFAPLPPPAMPQKKPAEPSPEVDAMSFI